ncbi:MAG: dihydroorotate dehydrogenase, partial [Candidatus Thermoplasmatota archaeon]|nr:dihydroorotate dehydrogenase [Candidatus Thermoplasmatota archaeon]
MADIDLTCKVGKVSLRNPSMLASGILGETAASMLRVHQAGAGAVVTKSIGLETNEGYLNPTVFSMKEGLLNAMGLPNPGIMDYGEVVERLVSEKVTVIGSIYGSSPSEFAKDRKST